MANPSLAIDKEFCAGGGPGGRVRREDSEMSTTESDRGWRAARTRMLRTED